MNLTALIPLLKLFQESGGVSPKPPAPQKEWGVPPKVSQLGLGFKQRALTGTFALTAEQAAQIGGPSRLGLRPKGL